MCGYTGMHRAFWVRYCFTDALASLSIIGSIVSAGVCIRGQLGKNSIEYPECIFQDLAITT